MWLCVHSWITLSELAVHSRIVIQVDELTWEVAILSSVIVLRTLSDHLDSLMCSCKVRLFELHLWQEAVDFLIYLRWLLLFILLSFCTFDVYRWDWCAVELQVILLWDYMLWIHTVHCWTLWLEGVWLIIELLLQPLLTFLLQVDIILLLENKHVLGAIRLEEGDFAEGLGDRIST